MSKPLKGNNLIFFIGFSGCGKSTIGRKLARMLSYSYCDLDKAIECATGFSIEHIISEKGEDYFREIENEYLHRIIGNKYTVISCGGGTPAFHNNMKLMNEQGLTVYLKMNAKALKHRLERSKTSRPLLKDLDGTELLDGIKSLLSEREKYYNQAKLIIAADKIQMPELVRKIKAYL